MNNMVVGKNPQRLYKLLEFKKLNEVVYIVNIKNSNFFYSLTTIFFSQKVRFITKYIGTYIFLFLYMYIYM